jgi:DNA-binding beta-propeller fold protein YncE
VLAVSPLRLTILTGTLTMAAALMLAGTTWGASGGFVRAWGKDVVTGGGTPFEICTQAASCKAGIDGAFDLGGEFDTPLDIAVDSAGNSYVADAGNERIQKFDPSGKFVLAWGKDVVAGNDVTGYEICTVAQTCQHGSEGGHGGEFKFPSGVAVDSGGNVYVADSLNNRIQKFDLSGDFLLTWGKDVNVFGGSGFETCNAETLCVAGDPGSLGGEFSLPWNVAIGPDGSVYVTEVGNLRVQKFNSSAGFLLAWGRDVTAGGGSGSETCTNAASCQKGGTGSLGGEFQSPFGVAVDGAGDVYVADDDNQRVQKFNASGSFLRTWGNDVVTGGSTGFEICTDAASCKAGNGDIGPGGALGTAWDVATDAANDVYVADNQGERIQKFNSSGNFLRTWGKDVLAGGSTGFEICTDPAACQQGATGGLGGELANPLGLETDAAGKLYVVDNSNSRIHVFGEAVDPPPPPPTGTTDGGAQMGTLGATETANPHCAPLRKKLKKAKKAHRTAEVRKLRRKLRRLGC